MVFSIATELLRLQFPYAYLLVLGVLLDSFAQAVLRDVREGKVFEVR